MHIFYPHFCRKSKKNIQKEMENVDEFQNILREKCRINKTRIYKKKSNTFIINGLLDCPQ